MSENPKLNNFIHDMDLEFSYNKYEVDCPYHGGLIRGDIFPIIFGIQITCDDDNPDYINTIRNAKEEDYIQPYNEFLKEYLNFLKFDDFSDCDEDVLKNLSELIEYLENTNPCFYSVEASS
jgi:hypothetical protein